MMSILDFEIEDGEIAPKSTPSNLIFNWYKEYWQYPGYVVFIGHKSSIPEQLPKTHSIRLGNTGMISTSAAFFYVSNDEKIADLVSGVLSVPDTVLLGIKEELSHANNEMYDLYNPTNNSDSDNTSITEHSTQRRRKKYELEERKAALHIRLRSLEKTLSRTKLCVSPDVILNIGDYFPDYGPSVPKQYSVIDFDLINSASMDVDSFENLDRTSTILTMIDDGSMCKHIDSEAHALVKDFVDTTRGDLYDN